MSDQVKRWIMVLVVSLISVRGAVVSAQVMAPETVTSRALGGVHITLNDVDVSAKRLVFDIQGEDMTQIVRGAPIGLTFDAMITHLSVLASDAPITIATSTVGQTGTLFHSRSPFAPPLPWKYRIAVEVATLPKTGQFRVGAETAQDLMFELPLAPSPAVRTSPAS